MRLREARRPSAVTHTRVLLNQTQENIPEVEVFMLQGLLANGPQAAARRDRFKKSGLIWVDEAHHPVGPEWIQLAGIIGDIASFGSTATPQRADGRTLGGFWTDLITGAQYSELLALGHLCPCDVATPELSRKDQKKGKVRPDGVASYLELGKRADGSWRPAIHTDQTISKCREAIDRYSKAGIRCALVTCDTGDDERQRLFDQYSAGHLDLLASPMALSEGFDSPRAEVLCSQRTFAHAGTYVQWCGRILRPYGEREIAKWTAKLAAKGIEMHASALVAKERALFIDTTDAKSIHGSPTTDRSYSLEGRGMELTEEKELREAMEAEKIAIREVETKYEIVRDRVVEHYIRLEEMARERGYKPGWVYYQMKELGIDPPRAMESKYASTCKQCRRKVSPRNGNTPGETILWAGTGNVFHRDCFFASLGNVQLENAYVKLEYSQAAQ
jgi:superfamily II DNA or RNA helicase